MSHRANYQSLDHIVIGNKRPTVQIVRNVPTRTVVSVPDPAFIPRQSPNRPTLYPRYSS